MKTKVIGITTIIILTIAIHYAYSQEMDGVKVTDAGTFSGSINGNNFNNPIRYSEAEDLVTIATGDEGFTLTINCEGISNLSELKKGKYKLPGKEGITVLYLDNNAAMPFVISKGEFAVTDNDGKILRGTLEFTASAGGIPKEMGGSETRLSGGKFEITKKQ